MKFILILLVGVMIFLVRMNVCTRVFVAGNSMNPTYYNGDVLIVWKIDREPKEYDVVIAKIDGMEVVKRVVARPGDYVFYDGNMVYINGELPEENLCFATSSFGNLEYSFVVPDGKYLLLGDNRDNSTDSREYGLVSQEDIEGIVIAKIFPL